MAALLDTEERTRLNKDPMIFSPEVDNFRPRFTRASFLALTWIKEDPRGHLILANDKTAILNGTSQFLKPNWFRRIAFVDMEVGTDHAKIWVEQGNSRIEVMIQRDAEFPTTTFLIYQHKKWTHVEKEGFGKIEWSIFDKVLDWIEKDNKMGGIDHTIGLGPSHEGKPLATGGS